jgi:hypothetical protein
MEQDRRASLLICDEILIAMNGKYTAAGIFTGDIVIPSPATPLPQLVTLFMIETSLHNPLKALSVEVNLPMDEVRRMDVPINLLNPQTSAQKLFYKWPFLLQRLVLRIGFITARVVHESGTIEIEGPAIRLG